MTIREAITRVLTGHDEGLTCQEIYNAIITDNLYTFNAINPQAIVKSIIRRQCYGLDFPTASISKYFKIVGGSGKGCAMEFIIVTKSLIHKLKLLQNRRQQKNNLLKKKLQ